MRPNRQQTFRTDAAAKLDQLELVAALLERDATNNRAFINEINSAYSRRAAGGRTSACLGCAPSPAAPD